VFRENRHSVHYPTVDKDLNSDDGYDNNELLPEENEYEKFDLESI